MLEVLGKHLNEPLIPPRRRAPELDIPEQAERILAKALVKDPERRYTDMAELREELLQYLRSIGVEDATGRHVRTRRAETFATRGDVDRYERRLSRANRFGVSFGTLLLLGAGYSAYALSNMRLTLCRNQVEVEVEPNDTPAQANLLIAGQPIRAGIGKRLSTTESDADVYRIDLLESAGAGAAVPAADRVADISVSALPNLDLMIELVEKGSSRPVLVVDTGKLGEAERIPNAALRANTYYVRVREGVASGKYPTENVSDTYTIALALTAQAADAEREPNDGFEVAHALSTGTPLRGLIGWAKDRDVYCVATSNAALHLEVSGVPGLDLVLAYLDRGTDAGQRIDRLGPGAGERIELPPAKSPRQACFTVSAREREGALLANPEHPYEIALR